jgi:hypothetical protein
MNLGGSKKACKDFYTVFQRKYGLGIEHSILKVVSI